MDPAERREWLSNTQGAPDWDARKASRRDAKVVPVAVETTVLTSYAFANCDGYVDARGDGSAVGAIVRLYAVTSGVRTLEAQATIGASGTLRVSSAGRGCETWDMTVQTAVGVPQPKQWNFVIVSFDGAATAASSGAGGGGGILAPRFSRIRASSGVVSAIGAQLLAMFGNYTVAGGAGTRWLQIFDAAALPANGTAPVLPSIPLTAIDTPFSLSLTDPSDPVGSPGKAFVNGIVWAVSSTESTLTIDNASTFDVGSKFQ